MTGPLNDPKNFADEALAGFCSAHACHVRRVTGGVVRSTRVPAGEVAVVVGGGSGHYPAYMGWVGAGFAHGAAVGNVFASPSAAYVYSVAKAADRGAGVIFGFGNYSGDVLNFRAAQQQLIAEGIDARLLIVTDDVASGTAEDGSDRRGIAGGLVVLKIAAAAASAGLEIEDVFAVGERANKRTRSIGIAYSGCTLPGASAPLFVVEDGTMAVGLGIHGEPGIETRELATADQSAALMVDRLLADAPGDVTDRVTVVLNGLGATKYEELFVVYQSVLTELKDRGLTVISPQIGEFVTSFDMAGLSLTVTWLDDELEQFWLAPADSPGFTMTEAPEEAEYQSAGDVDEESAPPPPASDESYAAAIGVADILDVVADMLAEVEHDLGELDAIAGDGDHGIGMTAGSRAAAATARDEIAQRIGAGTLLTRAGAAWAASAG